MVGACRAPQAKGAVRVLKGRGAPDRGRAARAERPVPLRLGQEGQAVLPVKTREDGHAREWQANYRAHFARCDNCLAINGGSIEGAAFELCPFHAEETPRRAACPACGIQHVYGSVDLRVADEVKEPRGALCLRCTRDGVPRAYADHVKVEELSQAARELIRVGGHEARRRVLKLIGYSEPF